MIYAAAKGIRRANLPLPAFAAPALRILYSLHQIFMSSIRWTATYFYREPLFRGRCESIGKRFTMSRMPFVLGHAKIYIGDDVNFFGQVDIFSGRIFDSPKLTFANRVNIGHNVSFVVNKEIVIEDEVMISSGVHFMDTDSHQKNAGERIAGKPPRLEEIRSVRVCKAAWIGGGCRILKGVTIGEGAIIGVNSVVVTDIPPYSVAMGNPARVVVKDVRGGTR